METSREYYDRVMLEYRSSRGRRSLRKYCQDEGIDYQWLMKIRKEYSAPGQSESDSDVSGTAEHFIPLEITESVPQGRNNLNEWGISQMVLSSPTDMRNGRNGLAEIVRTVSFCMRNGLMTASY